MAKSQTAFVCQNCGAVYSRWQGKCEACGEWNTIAEEQGGGASMPAAQRTKRKGRALKLEPLQGASEEAPRTPSGITELDRVTGGGFVRGSVVLIGGDPGHRQVHAAPRSRRFASPRTSAGWSTSPARRRSRRCGCAPSA